MDIKENRTLDELNLSEKDTYTRPINRYMRDSIPMAYKHLGIKLPTDAIYMNYKTGKPLTSSTLNRELQRLSERFLADVDTVAGVSLKYKTLKSNAFEIAWALDLVKKNRYSKQIFSAVSTYMGHRTIKDTIKLLEVKPDDKGIYFGFDLLDNVNELYSYDLFNNRNELKSVIYESLLKDDAWS